jgi:AraC-like DNA-binding protein
VRVSKLAELAHLSLAQLKRHFRYVFQITPQQALTRLRIEAAMRRLPGDDRIAKMGLA